LSKKLGREIDLSILIPIYGEAPYLEMTLESIKIQENPRFEVVVVLDRPSERQIDRTKALMSKFVGSKVLISPSTGISNALNFGLVNCLGTFIARIDSDDEMISQRLEIQMNFLERYPRISCVGTQVLKINSGGQIVGQSTYPTSNFWVRRILRLRNCVAHPATMYKRSDVLSIGGYRPQFDGVEDYDLWLRLIYVGQIANLEQPLTRYRIWDGQNSTDYKVTKLIDARIVNSFSWIERRKPEIAKYILTNESNPKNFKKRIQSILRNEYPRQWLFQEVKHFINLEISFIAEKSKLKFILSLAAKTLIFSIKTAFLLISGLEKEDRKDD
jgi:glycosyltransferase involved in cell wall biosynthesis